MTTDLWMDFGKRFGLSMLFAAVIMLALSEGYYLFTRDENSRAPKTIELNIPAGTAELIQAGQAVPSIPESLVFVQGDTLVVHNEDNVPHELGPLWIPAGSSASLEMKEASDYAYDCSFQPSRYLGLTVRQAVTLSSRLAALWYGVPPMLMLFLIYSYLIFPQKKQARAAAESEAGAQFKPEMGWRQFEEPENPARSADSTE